MGKAGGHVAERAVEVWHDVDPEVRRACEAALVGIGEGGLIPTYEAGSGEWKAWEVDYKKKLADEARARRTQPQILEDIMIRIRSKNL